MTLASIGSKSTPTTLLLDTAVPAHHRLVGRPVGRERAGGGQEVIVGILGVEAHLDRRADPVDVVLVVAEFGATRDPQLLPHEIDTGHLLGDRMLDLEAGVDLEKEELRVASSTRNSTVPADS